MTKDKVILIIGVLLLIALSIQSYSIYLLNNRVIELSRPNLAPSISSILQPVKFAENEAGIISKFKHNP